MLLNVTSQLFFVPTWVRPGNNLWYSDLRLIWQC